MNWKISVCVALPLHVRLANGNYWSKQQCFRVEMKCRIEEQYEQLIGSSYCFKIAVDVLTQSFFSTEQHYNFLFSGCRKYRPFPSSFLAVLIFISNAQIYHFTSCFRSPQKETAAYNQFRPRMKVNFLIYLLTSLNESYFYQPSSPETNQSILTNSIPTAE